MNEPSDAAAQATDRTELVEEAEILRQFFADEPNRIGDRWHSSTAAEAFKAHTDYITTIEAELARLQAAMREAVERFAWIEEQADCALSVTAGCATTHGDPGGGLEEANRYASDIAANASLAKDTLTNLLSDAPERGEQGLDELIETRPDLLDQARKIATSLFDASTQRRQWFAARNSALIALHTTPAPEDSTPDRAALEQSK